MKRLPVVILVMLVVLVAVVTGCSRAPHYDSRLVAADSLMRTMPDSALALVEAVSPDSLSSEGDRAYRDLLLTQARYRCYIVATSDSAINRALNYYSNHSNEREKLTRAYIYKGAVMEDLGYPDSAMFYYKFAEVTADKNDYFNLGYAKMRMGALYHDNYAMDGKDAQKYEEALECLKQIDDLHYRLVCTINLASLLKLKQSQKAEPMLIHAKDLARELEDTANFIVCNQNLIAMYNYHRRYYEASPLIQEVLSLGWTGTIDTFFFTEAAGVYAAVGLTDSAEYLLSLIPDETAGNPVNEISRLQCLGDIALAKRDTMAYLRFEQQANWINDSLLANDQLDQITFTEAQLDKTIAQQMQERQKKHTSWLVAFFLAFIMVGAFFYRRHIHRYDRIIADFKQQSDSQLNDLEVLSRNIEKLQIQDSQLKNFISSHLGLMREMIEACYHAPRTVLSDDIQRIVKLQKGNKDSWEKLYNYIDIEYHHIMTETRRNYPQLNDRDMLLLALTCLGYSCAQIAIIFGYANASTIGGNRQRLAKKMGLSSTLNEYINKFQQQK